MEAGSEEKGLDGLSDRLEGNVEVGLHQVFQLLPTPQLDVIPGHGEHEVSAFESRNCVRFRWAKDVGENPVGLVGKGLQQFSSGKTPQFYGAICRSRNQQVR